jgi:S1-C subfamily serine protease
VTAASVGVVVAWVDPDGASSEQLMVGDVIEAVDGRALITRPHWDARVARLAVGETLALRVRRRDAIQEVAVVASAPPEPPATRSLGLTLRGRATIGADVVRLERGSAAERAGLAIGDVITRIADVAAPTPAQVVRSFAAIDQGGRVLVAVTRGDTHLVTTMER